MTGKFRPESAMSEYESKRKEYSETEKKTKLEIFKEFDPKLTELNARIISRLSEHGSDNIEELKGFNKEGKRLGREFFDKAGIIGQDFNKKFAELGLREFELSWLDLVWYRNDQREKRHRQETKAISELIKTKPSTAELRALIEKAKAEVLLWKQLEDEIEKKIGRDFVGSAIWDAIEDKISEIKTGNGLDLLEQALEDIKDERQEYTEEDLEEAERDLERANEIGMSGNNPNAGRARQQVARARVRTVEQALKQSGKIEKTLEERLTEELDKLYPNAKSKTVVEYQGKKYQVRYFPLESSRTGKTVFEWGHQWVIFSEESAKKSSEKRTKKK